MTNTTNIPPADKAAALAAALEQARRTLHLETLDERGSDCLDFYDLSVSSVRAAIEAAFEAGYAAGVSSK